MLYFYRILKRSNIKLFSLLLFVIFSLFIQSCSKEETNNYGEDYSIIVCSDPHQGYGVYSTLVKEMSEIVPKPLAMFCCGDIMLRPGNEVEWINFWRYSKPVTSFMPIYIARGNHEGFGPEAENMLHRWGKIPGDVLYYSKSIGENLCIVLDCDVMGQENSIDGDQLYWLRNLLEQSENDSIVKNVFIFMHKPLFSQGVQVLNPLHNKDTLHSIFIQKSKIKGVFSGHDHIFNKYYKDGLCYITTGGAGSPLDKGYGGYYHHFVKLSFYSNPSRLNIKTIGLFNEVIENFDL